MRKATLSLALFFAAISSQAAIVYKNFSQPVNFQYFLSCANAGQGEIIDLTGSIDTTLAETFANNSLTFMRTRCWCAVKAGRNAK